MLTIRDAMGVVVATSTSNPLTVFAQSVTSPLPTTQVVFVPPASGTYYVEVADEGGNFGPDYTYVIEEL